jgi:3alpha(or 20beta)-hydroxysteroid dehydrogenase
MGLLDGRVAVVTGAARGQGAAEARLFHAEGAKVVLADVIEASGTDLATELGDGACFVRLDVSNAEDWQRAIAVAEDAFGPIDVLVNNAGVLRPGGVCDVAHEDFAATMDINVWGCLLGMQAVVPSMRRAGRGSIVNVASTGGIIGQVGVIAYVGSKFAVRGITKAAALELSPEIRVNSLHPGWVDTPMSRGSQTDDEYAARLRPVVPMGRAADPHELAKAALFLASDLSSYVTGAELVVDGGRTAGTKPLAVSDKV